MGVFSIYCRGGIAGVAVAIACLNTVPVLAAEFMVFPQAATSVAHHSEAPRFHRQSEWGADFFVTHDFGAFRFLAEYLLANRERELERLQFGWTFNSETTFWLGRFHSPIGYWNTEFHHGEFLQTSIQHPAIENYEDESGVVPAHLAGLLIDHKHDLVSGAAWRGILSFGQGPRLGEDGLTPWDLFHRNRGGGRVWAARMSYYPDAMGENEIGVFTADSAIPVQLAPLAYNRQRLLGFYGNWQNDRLRVISAIFRVRDAVSATNADRSQAYFSSAYSQIEYAVSTKLKLYGRVETTAGGERDAYLNLMPEFARQRGLAGVRRELSAHQALKLEWSSARLQDETKVTRVQLQWSMVIQ